MNKNIIIAALMAIGLPCPAFAAVDLNNASVTELESVNGVGPAKAQAIVDYRKAHGNFKSVDELDNVKGFGKKSVDKLKGEFSVGAAKPAKVDKPAAAKTEKKAD